MDTAALIDVQNLFKYFPLGEGFLFQRSEGEVKAVDGVSFSIKRGEIVSLVGESGCGKSTVGRVLLRLLERTSGTVLFEGNDIFDLKGNALRVLRQNMQIIFQDPFSSLNPRHPIGSIISEPLEIFNIGTHKERSEKVKELMRLVGLSPNYRTRYPHEFSGGQRQRIGIARALALNPKFIVCDEPVSALDVSVQAQVINLLIDLQEELDLTYLFISHDLSVVRHISHRVMVMYLGTIVEVAPKEKLYDTPLHPYTKALLASVPHPDPKKRRERSRLVGDVPSPINIPSGCRFHTRCPEVGEECRKAKPELRELSPDHFVSCFYAS